MILFILDVLRELPRNLPSFKIIIVISWLMTAYLFLSTWYPLQNYLSYSKLSSSFRVFFFCVSSHFEPQYYHQAIPFVHWQEAMKVELNAMEDNNAWQVVPLPKGKHSIGCKWIYKIKHRADGSIERYKARLVAKSFTQQEGLDFIETFSPVAKLVTVRVLLIIVVFKHWPLVQLDVNNAFLHGDLFEEVYIYLPLGYKPNDNLLTQKERLVCRLNKSIYGLKQASRQWFAKFPMPCFLLGFVSPRQTILSLFGVLVQHFLHFLFMSMT